MTDPYAGFRWLDGLWAGDIYCASFVRDLSPREALTRFGTDASTIEEVTYEKVCERAVAGWEASPRALPGYLGAVEVGSWTLIVEPFGWGAAGPDVRARVSRGTEIVVITRHEYSTQEFIHEIDGETITYFDLIAPERRWGSDPNRWVDAMREVGLDPDQDDSMGPHPDFGFANVFALASKITKIHLSEDVLGKPFLGAETNEK
ncbi:DUF6461 domain-containing protein [Streptosporangium sp. NPDC000095]|uniref:DUF6461 domain-containing protein n=1 Tax=Streptosporangium sp. NPDC000095 TaxID=3366184 RepID=UPI00367F952C